MAKLPLNLILEEDAKGGIEKAAKPILGPKGSMTKLLEQVGDKLNTECKRLDIQPNETGTIILNISLERVEIQATTQ